MIATLMCLTRGHEVVFKQEGSRTYGHCVRCGVETPGWAYGETPADVAGSQAYWDAAYNEFMDTELALHGGG